VSGAVHRARDAVGEPVSRLGDVAQDLGDARAAAQQFENTLLLAGALLRAGTALLGRLADAGREITVAPVLSAASRAATVVTAGLLDRD
jgi:hypothetical protein